MGCHSPCVHNGPAAQNEQLSSKEAAVHVLGVFQVALCCCGYKVLGITPDKDLLQQSDVNTSLLDGFSDEPVNVLLQ